MEHQRGQGLQMLRTTLLFSSCKRLDSFSPSQALKLTGAVRTQHSSTWQHLGRSCTQTRSRTISTLFLFSLGSAAPFPEPLGLPNSSVPQSHLGPPRAGTQPPSEQQGPVGPPASSTSAQHKLLCTDSTSRTRPRVQVYLLPPSPPATGSHRLAWANAGTVPQLTEKSWFSAMLVPHTSSPPSPDSPLLARAEEAASPMVGFAGLYDRPLGVAGPKSTGSRFSAWHKLPLMPQSLQDQGTSQGASCWTWEKVAESRNGKTKPCCGPADTDK